MIGERYKGNFNYICNILFLKLIAVNSDFCSIVNWSYFIKGEILYIRGLIIQLLQHY